MSLLAPIRSLPILGILILGLLIGCGQTRDWSGTYTGRLDPPIEHTNSDIARTLSAVNLQIIRGNFDLFYKGMAYSGAVHSGMEEAKLEVTKVADRPSETSLPPLRLKWRSEGELELLDGAQSVLLQRKPASNSDATAPSTGP